ncbi:hypothetical protein J6590_095776 [Homalodisca vitripennis]|nr:hypothetical protein J6590_095776 [Homalodisca vitripennis]
MTGKEKKQNRKVWRKRKAALRKKNKDEELSRNTPPNSDTEDLTKAKLEKYLKRLQRERLRNTNLTSPSPRKKVRNLVGHEKVSPHVKKDFAGYVLEKQLKSSVNSPKTKESEITTRVIGSKILRKYRVQKVTYCYTCMIMQKRS